MKRLLLISTIMMASVLISAQVILVPSDQPTIQAGINAANKGDTVLVDTGTYLENINFRGKAITVASHYLFNPDSVFINNTIIDGSQPFFPDSAAVITFCNGEDSASIIYGFTITGGSGNKINVPAIGEIVVGGGICCDQTGAKIIHNKIINNQTYSLNAAAGGGIGTIEQGDLWIIIRNNRIENNLSSGSGMIAYGGGAAIYGKTRLEGNIIHNNHVLSIDGWTEGGGAYVEAAIYSSDSIIIRENVFSSNISECTGVEARGGGLFILYGKSIITGNTFHNNSAIGTDVVCFGGAVSLWNPIGDLLFSDNLISENFLQSSNNLIAPGIHIWEPSGDVIFTDNVLYRNIASKDNYSYGGGASINDVKENSLIVERNIFIENQAKSAGGLLIRWCYNVSVSNNLFSGNSSFRGGGLTMQQDQPTDDFKFEIINNTFSNNTADDWGGAIRMYDDEGGNVVSFNNLFWGNVAQNAGNTVSNTSADTIKIYYSDINPIDIYGNWSGDWNINEDPLFVPDDSLCHIEGGPCHNTGIDELEILGVLYSAPDVDFEGTIRPQGIGWDIGADECLMVGIPHVRWTKESLFLSVNPNPSSGVLNLRYSISETQNSNLEIYSTNGVLVKTKKIGELQSGEHNIKLNLSHLPNGLYFVRVQAGVQTKTSKIIIQK